MEFTLPSYLSAEGLVDYTIDKEDVQVFVKDSFASLKDAVEVTPDGDSLVVLKAPKNQYWAA
jgi:hypothetical protein